MKHFSLLYWKIFGVFVFTILILGSIYIFIGYQNAVSYFEETNQRLNATVAQNIAKDLKPFENGIFKRQDVEKQFKKVMELNPAAEIYLLSKEGKILAYSAPDSVVKRTVISLAPINQFIKDEDSVFLEDDNPRHFGSKKAFSAAPIKENGEIEGYVYIILGGDKYESATAGLRNSYRFKIGLTSILFTVFAALLTGLIAFLIITRDLNKIIVGVKEFHNGSIHKRIILSSGGELTLLADTFNNMADHIEKNMQGIRAMELSRRELLANVSHDLRSPLAVIQGYAETLLIKKTALKEDEKEHYASIIFKSSTKLKKLVDELFELSKLEANAIVPHLELFSISELLVDNVLKYRLLAEQKGVRIETNIPIDIPFVTGDIGLIDRVLQNLIDNALKFTPEHGTIVAGLKQMDGHVEVSIGDSGIGITPVELSYIFDRYTHGGIRSPEDSGTGLGLAISKKILELHHSEIKVKSKVEEGSIFYFLLPRILVSEIQ